LNLLLNDTYIQWGQYGSAMKMRQQACDTQANDHAKSGAAIERSITKASANYCNASWDIVDAVDQKTIKLDNVDKTLLPKEMQAMTHEQRVAHVAKLKAQRKGIQDQILQLAKAREEFLRKHRETIGKKDGNTLDQAAIKAVREQAGKKGFQFQE
jgi:vacuolar-type H+-ATPase subunit I/STV1